MNQGDVSAMLCPCCDGVLFRMGLLDTGVWAKMHGSPDLEQAADGSHFVKCPTCQRSIKFLQVPGGPSGAQIELAPKEQQPCGEP